MDTFSKKIGKISSVILIGDFILLIISKIVIQLVAIEPSATITAILLGFLIILLEGLAVVLFLKDSFIGRVMYGMATIVLGLFSLQFLYKILDYI